MSIFKKLFGASSKSESLDASSLDTKTQAIAAMLTSDDERLFLTGLEEAVRKAEARDRRGLDAMRFAMVARSSKRTGKFSASFYEPGVLFGRADSLAERLRDSRGKLIALATRGALLDDPRESGELLSATLVGIRGHGELESLAHEIYGAGGANQGYAFQLLYNEQRCAIAFRKQT